MIGKPEIAAALWQSFPIEADSAVGTPEIEESQIDQTIEFGAASTAAKPGNAFQITHLALSDANQEAGTIQRDNAAILNIALHEDAFLRFRKDLWRDGRDSTETG